MLRAGLGFLVLSWLLVRFPVVERLAIRLTVLCLRAVLALVHVPVTVHDDALVFRSVTFTVSPDCTPLMPALLACIAIIAFPSSLRSRAAGVAAALVVLWTYNLCRILALVWSTTVWPGSFEFVHVYLWQTVTLAVTLGTVVTWMRLASRPPRADDRDVDGPGGDPTEPRAGLHPAR